MTVSPPRSAIPLTTLLALGIIGILGPFGTDVYLPALPQMAEALGTSESSIRLTLSIYTLGMALGQLIIGSLSDRFGRRRLMISGGLLVGIAALSASKAEDLATLLVSCAVLGVGSAAGLVTGRAVISDKTSGREATKYFSLLQMVVSSGPIFGPLAGVALLGAGDWRLIFAGLSGFAVIGVVLAMMFVPETLTPEARQSAHPFKVFTLMGEVLKQKQFIVFAATIWLGFGMLFAYISSSSFVFQSTLGASSQVYAFSFALNGVGLVCASLLTSRLAMKFAPERIILFGLSLQGFAMLSLIVFASTHLVNLVTVGVCFFLMTTSMGFVFGPATSLAVAPVRYASGTALALVGSIQFVSAGISSSLTAVVSPEPLMGFLIVGSVATTAAIVTSTLGYRLIRSQPSHLSE